MFFFAFFVPLRENIFCFLTIFSFYVSGFFICSLCERITSSIGGKSLIMKEVLVVEDNEDNMELISFLLERNGYMAKKALTGQQGIDLALEAKLDFIILDIQLPDINGTDVLKEIRKSKINGDVHVIAMTSYAMSGDREKMVESGCNGYIEKPIDPEKVIDQIREIIGEKD